MPPPRVSPAADYGIYFYLKSLRSILLPVDPHAADTTPPLPLPLPRTSTGLVGQAPTNHRSCTVSKWGEPRGIRLQKSLSNPAPHGVPSSGRGEREGECGERDRACRTRGIVSVGVCALNSVHGENHGRLIAHSCVARYQRPWKYITRSAIACSATGASTAVAWWHGGMVLAQTSNATMPPCHHATMPPHSLAHPHNHHRALTVYATNAQRKNTHTTITTNTYLDEGRPRSLRCNSERMRSQTLWGRSGSCVRECHTLCCSGSGFAACTQHVQGHVRTKGKHPGESSIMPKKKHVGEDFLASTILA